MMIAIREKEKRFKLISFIFCTAFSFQCAYDERNETRNYFVQKIRKTKTVWSGLCLTFGQVKLPLSKKVGMIKKTMKSIGFSFNSKLLLRRLNHIRAPITCTIIQLAASHSHILVFLMNGSCLMVSQWNTVNSMRP